MQESEGAAQANIADSIIRWETISCDLCGASDSERLLDGIDWEFGLNALLRLVRCSKCGLVYLNPRPTLSSIPLIYPPSYGYYKESSRVRRLLKLVYYKITTPYPYLDGVKPGRILDVGCGTGSTNYPYGENGSLRKLRRMGWNAFGLELNESAAEIALSYGISIHAGRLADHTSFTDTERFDVVRFNHVLEHSVSPAEDLSIAAKLLKQNGRLIVSVPNIDSAAFFLLKKYWSGLDLPRHFYHFTPLTLRKYCENSGLRVHSEYHDGRVLDFVHSLKHFLQSAEVGEKNAVCQGTDGAGENAIAHLLSPISRACGYLAVQTLVSYFNRMKLSHNYTIVAIPK